MSHYYATVEGTRGPATRQGTKNSGIRAAAQTFDGSIIVRIDYDARNDEDVVTIGTGPGSTTAMDRELWSGPLRHLMDAERLERGGTETAAP